MWVSWSWTQLTIHFGSRLTPNGKKQKQNHRMGSDDTTQCTVNSELGKETWGRGRIKRLEAEGEGKGHSFSQPQLCCCCKNIKVLLHSRTPQPQLLMAVLADHNTTPFFWGESVDSKGMQAFNKTLCTDGCKMTSSCSSSLSLYYCRGF